jgi:NhaP-type Na+/H+ or K+/H+ antiporter
MQTRLGSFIESILNILIGYWIAILSQVLIFPFFGIQIPLKSNLWIGFWFTIVSLIRSYIIRRWFNARIRKASQQLADITTHKESTCSLKP